jgi:hypothetical protein
MTICLVVTFCQHRVDPICTIVHSSSIPLERDPPVSDIRRNAAAENELPGGSCNEVVPVRGAVRVPQASCSRERRGRGDGRALSAERRDAGGQRNPRQLCNVDALRMDQVVPSKEMRRMRISAQHDLAREHRSSSGLDRPPLPVLLREALDWRP